jgi:tRNA wybutosine-synthesizing protein 1
LVKGLNLCRLDDYAELDRIADPDLIEPKGYVFVGGSRTRPPMSMANMPSHEEIIDFSEQLGAKVGMSVLKEKPDSRVTLLGIPGTETDVKKIYGIS